MNDSRASDTLVPSWPTAFELVLIARQGSAQRKVKLYVDYAAPIRLPTYSVFARTRATIEAALFV